ncbi:MAG TPA: urease accessory protein UreE [Polyangia bacterium]|nr:urease accessory protein UreE [Polyangia bacterium]
MLNVHEVIPAGDAGAADIVPDATVTLTFEERRRSRLLAHLDDGRELGLLLPRGTVLRDGDRLRARDGSLVVAVRAAAESLSVGSTRHPHLLTRAAYHLGNRHVPLEIGPGWVAYAHDHVLDSLVRALGLEVEARVAPFEPEVGAFHTERGGHQHDHPHGHSHSHQPAHGADHNHDHDAQPEHSHDGGGGSHRH